MSKFERKVIRKFALQTKKLMHSLCPTNKANKHLSSFLCMQSTLWSVGLGLGSHAHPQTLLN